MDNHVKTSATKAHQDSVGFKWKIISLILCVPVVDTIESIIPLEICPMINYALFENSHKQIA